MSISLKKREITYLFMIAGVLLLGYYIRLCFLPDKIAKINILTTIPAVVLFLESAVRRKYFKKSIFFIVILGSMSFLYLRTQMLSQRTMMNTLLYLVNLIMPLLIISLEISPKYCRKVMDMFVILMDCLVITMFLMLLVDVVTKNKLIMLFSRITGDPGMMAFAALNSGRKASVMGHYLPTAEVYIIYYIVHYFARNRFRFMYLVSMFISLIGISMAASKGGIVMIIGLILVFNIKDFRVMLISMLCLAVAYVSGLFTAVINRFTNSDLTSGRDDMWEFLKKRYDDLTPLVYGHGSESTHRLNQIHEWASAAFEYPFRAFAYEYGVIFTVLFYILAFGYPCWKLLKERRFAHLIGFGAVFLYANTYNGWVLGYDYMFLYCVFVFIVLNWNDMADAYFILRFIPKKYHKKFYQFCNGGR